MLDSSQPAHQPSEPNCQSVSAVWQSYVVFSLSSSAPVSDVSSHLYWDLRLHRTTWHGHTHTQHSNMDCTSTAATAAAPLTATVQPLMPVYTDTLTGDEKWTAHVSIVYSLNTWRIQSLAYVSRPSHQNAFSVVPQFRPNGFDIRTNYSGYHHQFVVPNGTEELIPRQTKTESVIYTPLQRHYYHSFISAQSSHSSILCYVTRLCLDMSHTHALRFCF